MAQLPLQLREFLEPPSLIERDFEEGKSTSKTAFHTHETVELAKSKIPPVLSFQTSSGDFSVREKALKTFLMSNTQQKIDCNMAALIVWEIGGLDVQNRMKVANMLRPYLSDTKRWFLVLESVGSIPQQKMLELNLETELNQ